MQFNAFARYQKEWKKTTTTTTTKKTVKSFQFDDSQTGNTTKTTVIRPLFMVKAVLLLPYQFFLPSQNSRPINAVFALRFYKFNPLEIDVDIWKRRTRRICTSNIRKPDTDHLIESKKESKKKLNWIKLNNKTKTHLYINLGDSPSRRLLLDYPSPYLYGNYHTSPSEDLVALWFGTNNSG